MLISLIVVIISQCKHISKHHMCTLNTYNFYLPVVLHNAEKKETRCGTSLVAQWLRLRTPNAGGPGLIPVQGTRSHMHATTKSSHATTKESPCHN